MPTTTVTFTARRPRVEQQMHKLCKQINALATVKVSL